SAAFAEALPLALSAASRDLRAVTIAISDMAKMPLRRIRPTRIRNSIKMLCSPRSGQCYQQTTPRGQKSLETHNFEEDPPGPPREDLRAKSAKLRLSPVSSYYAPETNVVREYKPVDAELF